MSMWFYQLSQAAWPPESYRVDIWQNERWGWPVGNKISGGESPKPGDTVVFFYAKAACDEPGFYGWAVVLGWEDAKEGEKARIYFRPVPPSDRLKMHPWGDAAALDLADKVRGANPRATLWLIADDNVKSAISTGILSWHDTSGASHG